MGLTINVEEPEYLHPLMNSIDDPLPSTNTRPQWSMPTENDCPDAVHGGRSMQVTVRPKRGCTQSNSVEGRDRCGEYQTVSCIIKRKFVY